MKKMTVCFLVLMMLLTLVIAGCSVERSSGKSGETELTFWTFNGLHEQFYVEMVKEWNKNILTAKLS